jgi:hypothetical protein
MLASPVVHAAYLSPKETVHKNKVAKDMSACDTARPTEDYKPVRGV